MNSIYFIFLNIFSPNLVKIFSKFQVLHLIPQLFIQSLSFMISINQSE